MKLLHKFFLAFFITSLVIVVLLVSMIASSLSSDFNEFVYEAENKQIQESQRALTALYQQDNSWQRIREDVQVWRDIVDPRPTHRAPPPRRPPRDNQPPRFDQNENRRQEKPDDFLKIGRRLSLYDADKQVIVGKRYLSENPTTLPITIQGEIIGWLGLVPSNAIKDSPASEFLAKQYQTFYLITAAALAFAFVMALLLSRHLSVPINKVIAGTNKLIKGDYKARINKVSQDELGTLSDNINNLAQVLEKNQKNRFQWMSDTSHELRTPLTVLKSQLMAIQDGLFEADDKRVQMFINEINNLSHIVDDLYQLSSSDAGALTYKKAPLNPVSLLKQVVESFQPKFESHSLSCDSHALDGLQCQMLADKDRLQQLFSNLLENTCRYTHDGGLIQVQGSVQNKQLELIIQDSAPGVSSECQAKLFERFYRVEQSRSREHGGSGLGLSLCKQIVEAHQGRIIAEDSPLGGLRMKITFILQ